MSKKEDVTVEAPKKEDDWMTKKWRPMMAIMYMTCCLFDFVFFPIMFTVVQFWEVQAANDAFRQWNPITLGGGGLFHVAMGAVLGVSAYGRTQEKLGGAANAPTSSGLAPFAPPAPVMSPPAISTPYQPRMEPVYNQPYVPQNYASLNTPSNITVGYGGKKAPPPADEPPI